MREILQSQSSSQVKSDTALRAMSRTFRAAGQSRSDGTAMPHSPSQRLWHRESWDGDLVPVLPFTKM